MTITDPAHAVRVLEALVNSKVIFASPLVTPPGAGALTVALVEGAKAVLEHVRIIEKNGWHTRCLKEFVVVMAQAYAPRMAEAGMEVPE